MEINSSFSSTSFSSTSANGSAFQNASTPSVSGSNQYSQYTEEELAEIARLKRRDREVRAHEQAHQAAAGQYAGAPRYTYQRGPDGRNYAVGGEVSVDTSPIPGDPEATLRKAQQLQRAALAPAEPSAQDQSVAAEAASMAIKARIELARQEQQERQEQTSGSGSETDSRTGPETGFDRLSERFDTQTTGESTGRELLSVVI